MITMLFRERFMSRFHRLPCFKNDLSELGNPFRIIQHK